MWPWASEFLFSGLFPNLLKRLTVIPGNVVVSKSCKNSLLSLCHILGAQFMFETMMTNIKNREGILVARNSRGKGQEV